MNPTAVNNSIFNGIPLARGKNKNPRKKETKPRQRKEFNLMHSIMEDLRLLEFHRRIIRFDRLNSGKIQTAFGGWVKLCEKGTSDLYIMLPGRLILWIETKADGKQSDEQIIFQGEVERAGHKYYIVKNYQEWLDVKAKHIVDYNFENALDKQ